MPYDWRLAFGNLEVRDKYFSRLKFQIEHFVQINDEKVVVVMHSMGSQVKYIQYSFTKQVEIQSKYVDWSNMYMDCTIIVCNVFFACIRSENGKRFIFF